MENISLVCIEIKNQNFFFFNDADVENCGASSGFGLYIYIYRLLKFWVYRKNSNFETFFKNFFFLMGEGAWFWLHKYVLLFLLLVLFCLDFVFVFESHGLSFSE